MSGFWHSLLVKLINEMFGFSHKTFGILENHFAQLYHSFFADPAAKVKNKNAISALFEEFLAAEKPDRSTAYEYICVMYIKYLQQMNLHAELELFAAEVWKSYMDVPIYKVFRKLLTPTSTNKKAVLIGKKNVLHF